MNSKSITKNKGLAGRFFKAAFLDCDGEASRKLITDEYIQHNPIVPSGAQAFVELVSVLKEQDMRFSTGSLPTKSTSYRTMPWRTSLLRVSRMW